MKYNSWLFVVVTFVLCVNCFSLRAQTTDTIQTTQEKAIAASHLSHEQKNVFLKDSLLKELEDSIGVQDQKYIKDLKKKKFTPNPQRALWLALVCPGAKDKFTTKNIGNCPSYMEACWAALMRFFGISKCTKTIRRPI